MPVVSQLRPEFAANLAATFRSFVSLSFFFFSGGLGGSFGTIVVLLAPWPLNDPLNVIGREGKNVQSLNLAGAGRWQRGENLMECGGFFSGGVGWREAEVGSGGYLVTFWLFSDAPT